MKKYSYLLTALIITSMLLAACGGGSQGQATATVGAGAGTGAATNTPAADAGAGMATNTPAADAGAGQATNTPAAGATAGAGGAAGLPANCSNVQLTYWNPFTGPDGPFMGQMVDEFNAANPNIQVTMNSQGDYYTQLTTAAASDTLPDVAIVHADQVATQAYRNVLRPMDDMVAGMASLSESDFPAAVWAAGEVAGKRYAIPLDIHPMTAFYNADLFQENNAGEAPMTREAFETAAQAITTGDNKGFMITSGFPVAQIFQMLLHQFGGSEFNEDGTEITWNSEAGVQALTWMKEAQEKYSEPNLEVDAELNAFKAGYVGMVWNGIWQITNVTGDAVEFDGRATSVPQIGTEMAVWAGSHQLTLPARQSGIDECKDAATGVFIQYLLDNSITWSRAGQIPASNSVRESAEFKDLHPQVDIAASVENAFFPPSVPGITDALGPMGEAVSAVMSGQATDIKAALDDAAARGQQILEQNRGTYGDAPGGGTP